MKKTKFFIALMLLLICISSSAREVKKHRDRLRFGYGFVQECARYLVHSDGSLEVVGVDITCREPGDISCTRGASNSAPPSNDLEEWSDLTSAEKTIGNNMINDAEANIESGQASGSYSQTITFVSPSGQSYYRTFSFTWTTNQDESIDSTFSISDPVNN